MAEICENIKKALEELSASNGGSLVKKVKKLKLTDSSSTLFVGLGGMGCKTINKIKEVYQKEFEHTDKVDFLAIDTDDTSLTEVKVNHTGTGGGYLVEDEETAQIYTDDIATILLENTPAEVEGWLGDVARVRLTPTGAKGVRQYSRVMLCGDTQNYKRLRKKVDDKIEKLSKLAPINVVLVAGIAGGTGSGTFVDFAYMIKGILKERFANDRNNFGFWGVFYTPDVQKNVPEIKADSAKWSPLQRNGYAAMKELDYFMSNGHEDNAAEVIYDLHMPGGKHVTSGDSMFENGNVFLVSATPQLQDRDEIIAATAKSIMNMYYDVSDKQGDAAASQSNLQGVISTYCNVAPTIIPTWCNQKVGIDNKGKIDGSGVENCDFPAFMNYLYSSFGYRSMYFPRDEIVAYLANKVFIALLDKWYGNNNQKKIDAILTAHKIQNVSIIANRLRAKLVPDKNKLQLTDQEMPHTKSMVGGLFTGDSYTGIEDAIKYAKGKVDTIINTYRENMTKAKVAAELVEGLVVYLKSEKYMTEHGPYEALEVLNGLSGGTLKGAIQYLGEMYTELKKENNTYITTVTTAKNTAEKKLTECKNAMLSDRTPTQKEVDEFVKACYNYQEAYLEYTMYRDVLPDVIALMSSVLSNENNKTFKIYVTIIDELKNMLNEDATILATSRSQYNGNVHTYGVDALGVATAKANEEKFDRIFDGYISANRVSAVTSEFVNSILGKDQREKWEKLVDSPEAMAEEIRRLFNDFSKPFMSDILDKFCVIAYSESNDAFALNADNIEEFWQLTPEETDTVKRQQYEWLRQTIRRAANNIIKTLGVGDKDGSAVMIREQVDALRSSRGISGTLMLLTETPRLNAEIKAIVGNECSYAYISPECKSVVSYVAYRYPYAVPLLYRIKDYAQEYYSAEVNVDTRAGRHLDEKAQNWVTFLPELYGVDTENYYTVFKNNRDLVINYPGEAHDKVLYEQIKEAYEYGVENGYIYEEKDGISTKYKVVLITDLTNHKQKLIDMHKSAYIAGEDTSLLALLENDKTIKTQIVEIKSENGPLMGRISKVSEGVDGLKNVYRVIRSDMSVLRAVLGAKKEYEDSTLFEAFKKNTTSVDEVVAQEKKQESDKSLYDDRIVLFSHMFLTKLLKHDEADKKWYFALEGLEKGATDNRKWTEFFKYSGLRSKIDILVNLYQAFNAFCAVDEEYIAAINEVVDTILGEGEETYLEKRQDIRNECTAVLKNDLLTAIPTSSRLQRIEEEYGKSLKKDFYQLPKQYDGPQTLIDNVTAFYNKLNELLDIDI